MVGGAVPSLKGDEFLALMPQGIDLVFEEFAHVPGSHVTPSHMLELAQHIESVLLTPDIDGAVVFHDTDTLEETAYLLELTIQSSKPVVLTGSMRSGNSSDYDGIANLSNAIRVAACSHARDMGVLVLFHGELHAASAVQQVSSLSLHAFQSPGSGPLGYVQQQVVHLLHRPLQRLYIPCARIEEAVDLIRLTQGADERILQHRLEDGIAGVVLEVFGSGRVPPWWLPVISEAIEKRVTIAIASRCHIGALGDDHGFVGSYHDLLRLGTLCAHNLTGIKTRIKLMVALGAARNPEELRRWFQA